MSGSKVPSGGNQLQGQSLWVSDDFDWTSAILTPSNCNDDGCSLQDIFPDWPTEFNFDEPPPIVQGCTDATAENWNEIAEEDDGSCVYSSPLAGKIVISEIHPKNNISSTAFSYIKLYNNSDDDISLDDVMDSEHEDYISDDENINLISDDNNIVLDVEIDDDEK